MLKNFIVALLVLGSFSSCLKNEGNACKVSNYDPCALKAPQSEINAVQDYLTNNGIVATQHCSGMFYTIDVMGTGATPTVCSNLSVTYEGKLTNGSVFDATSTPVAFNLSGLIPAWQSGLPLIKAGGTIHLYVPPTLGYGNQQVGPIPPNSILVFRVDVIGVQ
jgi:FKBP-type peptidyl-prolyl cis-trans isomerase FkpA